MVHAQVVQTTRDHHREVREPIFGIAKDIFDARAFDSRDGMFNMHAHPGDPLVVLLPSVRQLTLRGFFRLERLRPVWFVALKTCFLCSLLPRGHTIASASATFLS